MVTETQIETFINHGQVCLEGKIDVQDIINLSTNKYGCGVITLEVCFEEKGFIHKHALVCSSNLLINQQ